MQLPQFRLEEFFAKWEFRARYLLCASDVESWSMREILDLADADCASLWDNLRLGYTEPSGHPLLTQEISNLYQKATPSDVLCFSGAEEGIYCAMNALLEPKDHVIVITPCYQSLESLPKAICDATVVQLEPEKKWELDISEVERALQANTKLLTINFPHNPTGALLSRNSFDQLTRLASKHDLIIFSDEVYRYLEVDENDRLPAVADAYEKGISLSVMSKAFGLGGLRIGWIYTQNKTLWKKMAALKHYTTICNSAPSEILALIALRNREAILTRNRDIMLRNLKLLDHFFENNRDLLSWTRPKGGVIGFVNCAFTDNSEGFCAEVVKNTGALLLPGNVYGYPGGYFRIGFGRKNMPEALAALESYIQDKKV